MSLYSTAVKKPITTALCFVAVVVIGLFSFYRLVTEYRDQYDYGAYLVSRCKCF